MRAAAQVEPFALLIDIDVVALWDRVHQLDLEGFAFAGEEFLGLVAAPDLLGERLICGDDLAHLRLDLLQIAGSETLLAVEVVIEAVVDDRADGDLRAGEQFLYRVGHHMGGVVADEFQRFRVIASDDLDRGILRNWVYQIGQLAVDGERHGFLGQGFGDAGSQFRAGDTGLVFALGAVGKGQMDH